MGSASYRGLAPAGGRGMSAGANEGTLCSGDVTVHSVNVPHFSGRTSIPHIAISCVPRTPCRHAPQSIPPTPTHRPHYPQVKSDPSTKIILEGSQSTLAFYLSSGAKVRGGQEG